MAYNLADGEGLSNPQRRESQTSRKPGSWKKPRDLLLRKKERRDGGDYETSDLTPPETLDMSGFEGASWLRFEEQTQDNDIFLKFRNINSKILNWSSDFANNIYVDFNHVDDQEAGKRFFEIAPNENSSTKALSDLLEVETKKRRFIQGWIWLILVKDIFQYFTDDGQAGSDGQDFWMGEHNAYAVKTLERAFQAAGQKHVSIEDYNNWRAFTFALMSGCERSQLEKSRSKSRDIDRLQGSRYCLRKIQNLARQTMKIVKPWTDEDNLERLFSALNEIIKLAIELSKLLRCQRACWSIYYPTPLSGPDRALPNTKVYTDPSTMKQFGREDTRHDSNDESDSGQEPPQVLELFITPALFKRGNTDGKKYEYNTCMMKAVVTCKEPGQIEEEKEIY